MSLNAVPMRIVQSMDEVMAFKQERQFAIYDGGSEISYTPFPAQAVNNSNIQVTFNPPDEKTVVDPRITVDVTYELNFIGVGPGVADPLLVLGQFDGPRSFPLANTTSTVDLKVNGTSFNTNLNEYFSTINRTGMYARDFNQEFSMTPSALDLSQEYVDLQGSARNPLATYQDSAPFYQGRCSDLSTTDTTATVYVPTNTHTNATVFLSVNEPVFLSPFYPSKSGFAGCKTMTGTWTFSDLKRVWSHGDGPSSGVITSLIVNIRSFQVNFRYITPKDLSIIPKQICWPYHEFLIAATTAQTAFAAGATATINLSAINLEAHPQRILFVAREQDTDLITGPNNFRKTDTYARINNISINYGNNQGKLSSASPQDLYGIYLRNSNGSMSWTEWYSTVGSVLPVDVGKDIGLGSLDAPSKLSNPLLSANVNITNLKNRSVIYTLFAFVIYEGSACINHGAITKSIAVLNSQDVLKSQESGVPTLVHHEPTNIYGGNFFSSLKNAFMKGHDFVKRNKLLSKGLSLVPHPYAKAASSATNALGYGKRGKGGAVVTMPNYYEDLEELHTKGGKRKSRKVSRKSLKRRGGSLKVEKDGSVDQFENCNNDESCNNSDSDSNSN